MLLAIATYFQGAEPFFSGLLFLGAVCSSGIIKRGQQENFNHHLIFLLDINGKIRYN
jgi:hypothetical protein